MTIVEFLTAQYDEAETREHGRRRSKASPTLAAAHAFQGVFLQYSADGGGPFWPGNAATPPHPLSDEDAAVYYEEMWEPCPDEFVLADIAAKRNIVALHSRPHGHECPDDVGLGRSWYEPDDACPVQQLLALPFADRPGYDEAWRP